MRDIVVMTGRAGAGKTSIAMHLANELGYRRVRFAEKLKAMARALGLNDDEIEGHLKEVPCSKLTFETILWALDGERFGNVFLAILPEYDGTPVHVSIEVLGGKTLMYAMTSFLCVVLQCVAKAGPEGATPRSLMQMIGTDWGRKMIREDLWIDLWRREVAAVPEDVVIVIDDCRFPNEHAECLAQGDTVVFRVERDAPSALAGEIEKSHESEAYRLPADFEIENNSTISDAAEVVRHIVWANGLRKAQASERLVSSGS